MSGLSPEVLEMMPKWEDFCDVDSELMCRSFLAACERVSANPLYRPEIQQIVANEANRLRSALEDYHANL